MSGEGGYFFTNLCCAISFIENLDHASLSMDKEEFDDLMSGRRMYSTAWESALLACEGLRLMSENIHEMAELQRKAEGICNGILNVQRDIENFQIGIADRVQRAIEQSPLVMQPIKTPPRIVEQLKQIQGSAHGETSGHFKANLMTVAEQLSTTKKEQDVIVPSNQSEDCNLNALAKSLVETLAQNTNQTQEISTPDEKARQNFIQGIKNINYNIDFSVDSSSTSKTTNLLDNLESPGTTSMLLDSPIKPMNLNTTQHHADYKGFSMLDIPTISCSAGQNNKEEKEEAKKESK